MDKTALIPLFFLEEYLLKKEKSNLKDPRGISTGLAAWGDKFVYESENARFVSISTTRNILNEMNLPYDEFIQEYCDYLISGKAGK